MPDYLLFTVVRNGDPCFQILAELSGRVAALLKRPDVQTDRPLAACLDDLLGAVYSLMYARHYKYDDRPQPLAPEHLDHVLVRANDMANLELRTEGQWTAGFYFNNALFRLAAVYHRTLKIFVVEPETKAHVPDLLPEVKAKYRSLTNADWVDASLAKIHCEVNGLKHSPQGVIEGRDVPFDSSLKAVDEMLTLIEALK